MIYSKLILWPFPCSRACLSHARRPLWFPMGFTAWKWILDVLHWTTALMPLARLFALIGIWWLMSALKRHVHWHEKTFPNLWYPIRSHWNLPRQTISAKRIQAGSQQIFDCCEPDTFLSSKATKVQTVHSLRGATWRRVTVSRHINAKYYCLRSAEIERLFGVMMEKQAISF